jgi:hypothetical protein
VDSSGLSLVQVAGCGKQSYVHSFAADRLDDRCFSRDTVLHALLLTANCGELNFSINKLKT